MTVVRRGRSLAAYAREPVRDRRRRRLRRDKDGRLTMRVFEARKAEGVDAFIAWFSERPIHYREKLRALLHSHDDRVVLRAVMMLWWIAVDADTAVLTGLSVDDMAILDRWARRTPPPTTAAEGRTSGDAGTRDGRSGSARGRIVMTGTSNAEPPILPVPYWCRESGEPVRVPGR